MIVNDPTNIKAFYKNRDVVRRYDQKRFSGEGGIFVHETEIQTITSFLPHNFVKICIIDLATGTGRVAMALLSLGAKHVTVVDVSSTMLQQLKKKLRNKVQYVEARAEQLPFKRSSIDVIISLRLMEHLQKSTLRSVFSSVYNILKKDGYFSFNTVNYYSFESIFLTFFGTPSSTVYPIQDSTVESLLMTGGFRILKKETAFFFPRGLFLHLPKQLFPFFKNIELFLQKTPMRRFSSHVVWHVKKI